MPSIASTATTKSRLPPRLLRVIGGSGNLSGSRAYSEYDRTASTQRQSRTGRVRTRTLSLDDPARRKGPYALRALLRHEAGGRGGGDEATREANVVLAGFEIAASVNSRPREPTENSGKRTESSQAGN